MRGQKTETVEPVADAPVPPRPAGSIVARAARRFPGAARVAGLLSEARRSGLEFLYGNAELRPFLKPLRGRVAVASGFLIAVGLGGMLQTRLWGEFLDATIARHGGYAVVYGVVLLGAYLGFVVVDIFYKRRMEALRQKLILDVRTELYARLQRHPRQWGETAAQLSSRLVNDVGSLIIRNINSRVSWPSQLAILAFSVVVMAKTAPLLAVVATMVPILVWLSVRYGRMRQALENYIAGLRSAVAEEGYVGLFRSREAVLLGAQGQAVKRYGETSAIYADATRGMSFMAINYNDGVGVLSYVITHFMVFGLGFTSYILYGAPSIGEVTAMAGYAGSFRNVIHGLLNLNTDNLAADGTAKHVLDLLRATEAPAAEAGAGIAGPLTGSLALRGVKGGALTGATLKFLAGERTAVLDADGAGLAGLGEFLLLLEYPAAGHFEYDGTPFGEFSEASLRRRLALLDRRSTLLPGTLRDNLLAAHPGASDADLKAALDRAGADTLLPAELGLDADAAEVERLGQGPARRVLLARLYLQDPSVVVLDGPSADLAGVERTRFEDALEAFLLGRTVIWIWPDAKHLAALDRVHVLQAGRLAETGVPEELARDGSLYQKTLGHLH